MTTTSLQPIDGTATPAWPDHQPSPFLRLAQARTQRRCRIALSSQPRPAIPIRRRGSVSPNVTMKMIHRNSRMLERSKPSRSVRRSAFAGVVFLTALVAAPIATASDPLDTWHTRTSPYGTTNNWRGIAFGNDRFVAVNQSQGFVMTSTDGVDWAPQSANTTKSLYGLAFGGGRFVAVGSSGKAFSSTDGVSWQPQTTGTSAHLYHVNYNNGLFVAVGGGGTILSSPDGATWTPRNTGTTNQWEASCYGNGTHVVVGYRTQSPSIFTRTAASPSLTDWNPADSGASHYLSGVTYGDGKFVAVGYGGLLQTSHDGLTWSSPANAAFRWLYFVAYDQETFMAVGEGATITSSPNGIDWTNRHAASSKVLNGIAYGNGTWVAVGNNGLILQSDPVSGSTTEPKPIVLSNPNRAGDQFSLTFNGEIGQNYLLQSSPDLKSWTTVTNVVPAASPATWSHTSGAAPNRFYRVVKP